MFQIQTFPVTSPNSGYPSSHRLRFKCRICFRFGLFQLSTFLQAFSSSLFAMWNMFQIRGKHFFFSSSLLEMWNMFQIRTFPAICLEAGHPPSRRLRLEARLPLQAVVAITADTVTIEIYYAW